MIRFTVESILLASKIEIVAATPQLFKECQKMDPKI